MRNDQIRQHALESVEAAIRERKRSESDNMGGKKGGLRQLQCYVKRQTHLLDLHWVGTVRTF